MEKRLLTANLTHRVTSDKKNLQFLKNIYGYKKQEAIAIQLS